MPKLTQSVLTFAKPPGRPPARMAEPVDTATCHLSFRLIVRRPAPSGNAL